MSKVLVVGGTGSKGGEVAKRLKLLGHEVLVMVRSDEARQKALDLGVEPISGNLLDSYTLLRVTEGVEYIVATAAALDDSFVEGYKALFDYARIDDVKQLIFVSNKGNSDNCNIPMFLAKDRHVADLKASHLPFTVLKFDTFSDTMRDIIEMSLRYFGKFPIYADEGADIENFGKHYWIEPDRIVDVIVACVGNPAVLGKTIQVGGDETYTLKEFTRRYARERGADFEVEETALPYPGHEPFHPILKGIQSYDSPVPDNLRQFGISVD